MSWIGLGVDNDMIHYIDRFGSSVTASLPHRLSIDSMNYFAVLKVPFNNDRFWRLWLLWWLYFWNTSETKCPLKNAYHLNLLIRGKTIEKSC